MKPAQAALTIHGPAADAEGGRGGRRAGRDQLVGRRGAQDQQADVGAGDARRVRAPCARPPRPGSRWCRVRSRGGERVLGSTKGPVAARRVWIPLRSTIHSSVVSNRVVMSSLVTIRSGRAVPQPVMAAPGHEACSQAIGWPVWTRSPGWARVPSRRPANGERTSIRRHGAEQGADLDGRARACRSELVGRLEDPGARADHHPLGHVEVLALVAERVGVQGGVAGHGVDQAVEVGGHRHRHGRHARAGCGGSCVDERRPRARAPRTAARRRPAGFGQARRGAGCSGASGSGCTAGPDSSSSQSAAAVWRRASTLATTGISASWKVVVARILRSRLRAGAMNGVWKAPPTATGATLRAPSSMASSRLERPRPASPAMTVSSALL